MACWFYASAHVESNPEIKSQDKQGAFLQKFFAANSDFSTQIKYCGNVSRIFLQSISNVLTN